MFFSSSRSQKYKFLATVKGIFYIISIHYIKGLTMKYFNNSMNKFLAVFILLISTNAFALSDKAAQGKELYLDANCNQCHQKAENFDVKNNKAKDMNSLTRWVRNCDSALDTGWFPEEQESVAQYLNEVHYKHKIK